MWGYCISWSEIRNLLNYVNVKWGIEWVLCCLSGLKTENKPEYLTSSASKVISINVNWLYCWSHFIAVSRDLHMINMPFKSNEHVGRGIAKHQSLIYHPYHPSTLNLLWMQFPRKGRTPVPIAVSSRPDANYIGIPGLAAAAGRKATQLPCAKCDRDKWHIPSNSAQELLLKLMWARSPSSSRKLTWEGRGGPAWRH